MTRERERELRESVLLASHDDGNDSFHGPELLDDNYILIMMSCC